MRKTLTIRMTLPTSLQIDTLYKEWMKVKNSCKYHKFVEDKFKLVRQYITVPDVDGFNEIKSIELMNILRWAVAKASSLVLDDILLFSQTSERISVFKRYASSVDDATYWTELKNCYMMQDYKKISFKLLKSLFLADRPQKELLMNDEESAIFSHLPAEFTVYRGTTAKEKSPNLGLSWTLKKEIAQQFSDKKSISQHAKGVVLTEHIKKSDTIAYFNERQEEEIIYIKYP